MYFPGIFYAPRNGINALFLSLRPQRWNGPVPVEWGATPFDWGSIHPKYLLNSEDICGTNSPIAVV